MNRSLAVVAVLLAALPIHARGASSDPGRPVWPSRELTLEERVVARRAVEEVYWRHRVWPSANQTPKPALRARMSDGELRRRVEDSLRKSAALDAMWQRPISAGQLQAELDRMARDTRDPRILQELFDALGGDAFLIAETLARQTLADRLIRGWYARDERFHAAVRRRAEHALAACQDAACTRRAGGESRQLYARLRGEGTTETTESADDVAVTLAPEAWNAHLERLATRFGSTRGAFPIGRSSALEETNEDFSVTTVLSQRRGEIVTATTSWPKRSFDAWWDDEGAATLGVVEETTDTFVLPTLPSGTCTNDTWRTTHSELPDSWPGQTSVWTGSEMIVWGGSLSDLYRNTGGRYNPATDTWTPTSTGASVPPGRDSHTAIWTGTEMIVWGGLFYDGASHALNSGGRYDPTTDAWTATSIGANVPAARARHTALWTGNAMIVWGGGPNTGGRYDPVTDTWLPTSTGAGVPSGRSGHTAVWTGEEMLVWGGGAALVSGGRYRPATDTWAPISTIAGAPTARFAHTALWTGEEMIVWGGTGPTGSIYLNDGARYDPETDTWTPTSTGANVADTRTGHTAVWTGSEMIVWGGYRGGSNFLNSGRRYDPASNTWSALSTGPSASIARQGHTAVWTGDEMIVWGGWNGLGPVDIGDRYSPASDSWAPVSSATVPRARESHTAVWTGTEMIVWGGLGFGVGGLNSGGRYAPATDTWTPTSMGAHVPSARVNHEAVWTGLEMIVWGAAGTAKTGGRYDPATDTWKATIVDSNTPSERRFFAMVWTGSEVIVWGGTPYVNTGGRYNPSTNSWTATSTGANVPLGRRGSSGVWTGSEMIVWGGDYDDGANHHLNTGGRYNPGADSWTATSTASGVPAARSDHSAVWTGAEMIVWGGPSPGGRFDPALNAWAPVAVSGEPSARGEHTAVWTGAELIVWGGGSWLNTGGRYDPELNGWTATSTGAGAPMARAFHSAVWTGTEMIVWGGEPSTSTGGSYCACPDGRLVYRDADGDGFGSAALSSARCDGSIPGGYAADATDCDDSDATAHPGAAEVCNREDDDCNGLVDESESAQDGDGDGVAEVCDNCIVHHNASQSDSDDDGEGDACDLDDGIIWEWRDDKSSVSWQAEEGPTFWNVYIGDLAALRATGEYTQAPGSNALANRHCGQVSYVATDAGVPAVGTASFSLVTGVKKGIEGTLGSSSSGPRPNANPCP